MKNIGHYWTLNLYRQQKIINVFVRCTSWQKEDLQIGNLNSILVRNSKTCISDIKNRFIIVMLIFIYFRTIRKRCTSPCSTAVLKIGKTMELISYSTKVDVSKNRFAKNFVYHRSISKSLDITKFPQPMLKLILITNS